MEESKDCFWFEHQWSAWEDIEISGNQHIKIRQIRKCAYCNKKKARSVTYVNKVK